MAQELAPPLIPVIPAGAAGVGPFSAARWRSLVLDWVARHAELATATTVTLVTLLHLGRLYNRGFNLLDEGFVLHVSERVLQGQVPYRDFFTQLTPGAFLALAGVFALTGPSVIVGRWVTVALGLLITLLLYAGGRRVLSRPAAAVAALAFPVWGIGQGWFYPNYSWFALAAALLALLCLLRALREEDYPPAPAAGSHLGRTGRVYRAQPRSPYQAQPEQVYRAQPGQPSRWALVRFAGWAAAAGLSAGLAAFCKQNMGLYVFLALIAATLVVSPFGWRGRALGASAMAVAAMPIPLLFLLWLAAHGALPDFYRDAVWIPLAIFPREMAAPYPPFWPPWPLPGDPPGQDAWTFRLICLLPPLPYGLAFVNFALSCLRHRRPLWPARRAAAGLWLAFGVAIWATAFPRADFDHVQVALGPAFVIGAATLESIGRWAVRRRVWRVWGAPDDAAPSPAARWELAWAGAGSSGGQQAMGRARTALRRVDGVWCRRWLPSALACGIVSGFLVAGAGNARLLHMGPRWTLRTLDGVAPRASGILLDYDDAAELNRLVSEVRRLSAPGETIAALPWNAGLYFLAERRNATRFDLFIPASILPEDLDEIEREMDGARLVVYWTARDSFINNTSLDDRLPELHQHITSRYRAVAAINAYRLLLPGEAATAPR